MIQKSKLGLKKLTLRDLDDATLSQMAGGTATALDCGHTLYGGCDPSAYTCASCNGGFCTNGGCTTGTGSGCGC